MLLETLWPSNQINQNPSVFFKQGDHDIKKRHKWCSPFYNQGNQRKNEKKKRKNKTFQRQTPTKKNENHHLLPTHHMVITPIWPKKVLPFLEKALNHSYDRSLIMLMTSKFIRILPLKRTTYLQDQIDQQKTRPKNQKEIEKLRP